MPQKHSGIPEQDPERTLVRPHFDHEPTQPARSTIAPRVARKRRWTLVLTIGLLAGLAAGALGGFMISHFLKRQAPTESASTEPTTPEAANGETAQTPKQSSPDSSLRTPEELPAVSNNSADSAASKTERALRSDQSDSSSPVDPSNETGSANDGRANDAHAALRGALDEWLAATNARDIKRQMDFYGPSVSAFYLKRNAPRDFVRAEKARVFSQADLVDIRAGAPEIKLDRNGRTATMRFRKRYAIANQGRERRGEVLQELRWQRTDDGQWKIISERDLRVIN